ncbi:putative transporter YIL166C [Ceratocystis fimbriata CBS 114723]|uniref:Putative transporter YIL166C n=1 Tax=Ceratocystis fimbriata CBS 114723 TaxID=1035309 RepID=A0A2C5WY71_9PEZI|nr:putative transporter YIL166C [Ceratocystis fimbriata CBS 114723]
MTSWPWSRSLKPKDRADSYSSRHEDDSKAPNITSAPSKRTGSVATSSSHDTGTQATPHVLGSTPNHAFSSPSMAEYWREVYNKAQYENRHRFDPDFEWTADEEKKLIRKIDIRIVLLAWVMFCSLDLNRRNINRAISDNLLPELNMTTNDFNYGQTIFLTSFLAAELPSGLISKRLGADRWIPALIICCKKKLPLFVHLTMALALTLATFNSDVVLWLTYFYKSNELPKRLAFFWTALSTCNILGSFIAAGVLQMRGVAGYSGWQWLFLIEAALTLTIGLLSAGLMPAGPCQTAGWLRGAKGWFTEREEYIMVNRLLRDDPSKGDMNNRQGVGLALLWKVLKDWEMWPLYLIGLTSYIPPSPPNTYLSYILRQLGFNTFKANLLAIPSQFLFAIQLLVISWVSEKVKERSIISSLSNIWILPWLIALVVVPASTSAWVRYVLLSGLLSYPYCHAILVSWNARNSNSVRTRAVSAALYNMFVQAGNIIATNIYRDDDKPLYRRGNKILLAITVYNIFQFYLVKLFYIWRNKVREQQWNAMSKEEQEDYVRSTTDEGMKRLDFRFAH